MNIPMMHFDVKHYLSTTTVRVIMTKADLSTPHLIPNTMEAPMPFQAANYISSTKSSPNVKMLIFTHQWAEIIGDLTDTDLFTLRQHLFLLHISELDDLVQQMVCILKDT